MHYLQAGQIMRGFEQFLIDLMTDRDLAHAILGRLHQVYMRRVEAFLDAFGDFVDAVFLTDDLGTQQAGLISPSLHREMIFPYVGELIGRIKARRKKVIMHSCGAVSQFIPLLIEMGVDALNPVQVSAAGMNPRDWPRIWQGHRLLGRRLRHPTCHERRRSGGCSRRRASAIRRVWSRLRTWSSRRCIISNTTFRRKTCLPCGTSSASRPRPASRQPLSMTTNFDASISPLRPPGHARTRH